MQKIEFFKASAIGIVMIKARDSPWLVTIPVGQVIPCRVALQQSSTPLNLTIQKLKMCKQITGFVFLIKFVNKMYQIKVQVLTKSVNIFQDDTVN